MFDLVSGTLDRPFRDRHPGATVVSVAAHIIILGGVIGAALFVMTQGLPEVPRLMAFVADMPAPPPPPPPPPPPRAPGPKPVQPAEPVPTTGQFTFPVEVPIGIAVETGIDTRGDEGVPGGVEGGTPGGVVGGILGGIMTDVAPPPPPPPPPPAPPPPSPPVPQRLGPVRIGGEIKAPELVYRVEPIYPDIAVMAHATGVVILEATVNEQGEVTNVVVLRTHKLLERAAIAAVKQWRYTPLLLNGLPRAFVLTVTLNFSII
jgi:periplasmic protein TonB